MDRSPVQILPILQIFLDQMIPKMSGIIAILKFRQKSRLDFAYTSNILRPNDSKNVGNNCHFAIWTAVPFRFCLFSNILRPNDSKNFGRKCHFAVWREVPFGYCLFSNILKQYDSKNVENHSSSIQSPLRIMAGSSESVFEDHGS